MSMCPTQFYLHSFPSLVWYFKFYSCYSSIRYKSTGLRIIQSSSRPGHQKKKKEWRASNRKKIMRNLHCEWTNKLKWAFRKWLLYDIVINPTHSQYNLSILRWSLFSHSHWSSLLINPCVLSASLNTVVPRAIVILSMHWLHVFDCRSISFHINRTC